MKSGVLVPVAVVLACFPFACAAPGPAPRTYQQAPAFVAPPRPAPRAPGVPGFNPVEDAPHRIGHPGYGRRDYPKSPYERVLPQDEKTRQEDTIWAAEAPQAVKLKPPLILKVVVPTPAGPKVEDDTVARLCASLMDAAATTFLSTRNIDPRQWSNDIRMCVAAELYAFCINRTDPGTPIYDYLAKTLRRDPAPAVKRAKKEARDFRKSTCGEGYDKFTGDPLNLVTSVALSWPDAMRKLQERMPK